jgi:hypothetical protein
MKSSEESHELIQQTWSSSSSSGWVVRALGASAPATSHSSSLSSAGPIAGLVGAAAAAASSLGLDGRILGAAALVGLPLVVVFSGWSDFLLG